METSVQTNDREFLNQALKFYRNIDKYSSLINVDSEDLEAFKNDFKLFLFIADNRYRSFTESFIRYNIKVLRNRLEPLFDSCTASTNYTDKIGEELGIIAGQNQISLTEGWDIPTKSSDWHISPGLKYS